MITNPHLGSRRMSKHIAVYPLTRDLQESYWDALIDLEISFDYETQEIDFLDLKSLYIMGGEL